MEKPYWEDKEYAYFSHKKCEYFPCHKGADPEDFNCLFCYCPLYALGDKCGGNFKYNEKGFKDCTRTCRSMFWSVVEKAFLQSARHILQKAFFKHASNRVRVFIKCYIMKIMRIKYIL